MIRSSINSYVGKKEKEFPKIMRGKNTGTIYLVTNVAKFEAIVLNVGDKAKPGTLVGDRIRDIVLNEFEDWEGSVTLWSL